MLTGILVVAFPVSVFSDLWSQELKRAKEQALIEKARRRTARLLSKRGNITRDKEHKDYNDEEDKKHRPTVTFKQESPVVSPDDDMSSTLDDGLGLDPISRRNNTLEYMAACDIQDDDETAEGGGEIDVEHIVMDREHVQEIASCLHAIRSNERRVHAILERYGMVINDMELENDLDEVVNA